MVEVNIFLDEDDIYQGKPAHEYIVRWLMHHNISGATVIRGIMGYGKKMHLNKVDRFGSFDDTPLIITFIDEEVNVMHVLPHIKEVVGSGLIIHKNVEIY